MCVSSTVPKNGEMGKWSAKGKLAKICAGEKLIG